jgi:outer membrane protein
MNRILVLLLSYCFFVLPLFAQSQSAAAVESFTLEQLIDIARTESPAALQAETTRENRYWQYNTHLADYKPQLVLSSRNEFNREVTSIRQNDGTYAFPKVNQNYGSVSLSLEQYIGPTGSRIYLSSSLQRFDNFFDNNTLYSGNPAFIGFSQPLFSYNGLKWASKIDPLRFEESKRQYVETMEQISVHVTSLFFRLLLAQASMDIAKTNLNTNDILYKKAKERKSKGEEVKEGELLQLEVAFLKASQQLAKAEVDLQSSMLNLKSYIGLNSNDTVALVPPGFIPDFEVDIELALQEARRNRSAPIAFKRRKLQAERGVAWAKGSTGLNASINATFGLTNNAEEFGQLYQRPDDQQAVVLNLSFPIMDWGRQEARIKTAEANRELTEYTVAQSEVNFEQRIITHVRSFNMLRMQIAIAEKNDEIAQKSYENSKERYNDGEISVTDLNISMQEKDEAKKSYIAALRDFWIAYYQLRQLTLYDFENDFSISML